MLDSELLLLPGETLPLALTVFQIESLLKNLPQRVGQILKWLNETKIKNVMKKVRFIKKLSKKLVGIDPVARGVPTCQIDQLK